MITNEERGKIVRLNAMNVMPLCPTPSQRAQALITLATLIEYRDNWNSLDGLKEGWQKQKIVKWCIEINANELHCTISYLNNNFMYFGYETTRNNFYETFKDQLNSVRMLF